jgi:hypothetical protein
VFTGVFYFYYEGHCWICSCQCIQLSKDKILLKEIPLALEAIYCRKSLKLTKIIHQKLITDKGLMKGVVYNWGDFELYMLVVTTVVIYKKLLVYLILATHIIVKM